MQETCEEVDELNAFDDDIQDKTNVYLSKNKEVIDGDEESGFNVDVHNFVTNSSQNIKSYVIKYHRHV